MKRVAKKAMKKGEGNTNEMMLDVTYRSLIQVVNEPSDFVFQIPFPSTKQKKIVHSKEIAGPQKKYVVKK